MMPHHVVVSITTFNRVDCARINMEIVKLNYDQQWPIVHACSAKDYDSYIEDVLVRCEPKPLQTGAFNLLMTSIEAADKSFSPDFIVHLEADTWLMNQKVIEKYIQALAADSHAVIASSSWSFDKTLKWKNSSKLGKNILYQLSRITRMLGLKWHIVWENTIATQFFILKNTHEVRELLANIPEPEENGGCLEKHLYSAFKKKFGRRGFVRMTEREPVHPDNRDTCEALELYCQHFPTAPVVENSSEGTAPLVEGKKEILQRYSFLKRGPYIEKLLQSDNLDYYNPEAKRY